MLAVILYILKIIGIVLLCILGLILAVILLVLLCPWGYCIDVKKGEQLAGRAGVSWLFHFLMVEVLYQEGVNIRCRVLGIIIFDKQKRERKAAERAQKKSVKKNRDKKEPSLAAADMTGNIDSKIDDGIEKSTENEEQIKERNAEQNDHDIIKGDNPKNKKRGLWWEFPQFFFDLIIEWIEKAVDFLLRLPEILNEWTEHLEEKIEKLVDQYEYYTKLFQKKGSMWVMSFLKSELLLLLKHICPKRSKINIYYANDDPANVADMMAYYGMAMPFLPRHTTFTAELGEPQLTGTVRIKGRIFLIVFLWHGGKIFFNKKIRTFLKLLKREEE